ncbi:carboxymuconolactone decarboxylase family protein [Geotalea sp. SG265]|uniref:carboxymuconolactone decarboxylase family protein n=1 Tax=Geotalea sp. SG265 TaxID=2922867 RepID=UPI001FAF5935|nr:carboxymuconolactone decarboxylase family protein [Geotalea sp. SG265]
MLPEKQQKAYVNFYDTARENTILDPKTSYLLHIAAAMAIGCVPCMEYYLKQQQKEGVTDEEIGAAQAVAMAVSAGRINAQLRQAEQNVKKSAPACNGGK